MNYLRWSSGHQPGLCVIRIPTFDDKPLNLAQPLQQTWPENVTTTMQEDYPDDIALADNLYGSYHAIISEKMKLFLQQEISDGSIEYLPITIINHKGRAEPDPYYVLHPRTLVDCIDLEASEVEWNPLDPEEINDCEGLVLNTDAIPENCRLFRLTHWGSEILVRSDLAEKLEEEGFTGLYFPEAEGYDGIG